MRGDKNERPLTSILSPAGRGGVYLKIELKFQISLVRY
jgi:hypothetical protein